MPGTWTEDALDEALTETFPASDPLANTVETGIRVGAVPPPKATRPEPNSISISSTPIAGAKAPAPRTDP
jgi:hypothetical protein